MTFVPIKLRAYVRKHLQANPGSNERKVTVRFREALGRYHAGAQCQVSGAPIWVIGSAELGDFCHVRYRRDGSFRRLRDRRSVH